MIARIFLHSAWRLASEQWKASGKRGRQVGKESEKSLLEIPNQIPASAYSFRFGFGFGFRLSFGHCSMFNAHSNASTFHHCSIHLHQLALSEMCNAASTWKLAAFLHLLPMLAYLSAKSNHFQWFLQPKGSHKIHSRCCISSRFHRREQKPTSTGEPSPSPPHEQWPLLAIEKQYHSSGDANGGVFSLPVLPKFQHTSSPLVSTRPTDQPNRRAHIPRLHQNIHETDCFALSSLPFSFCLPNGSSLELARKKERPKWWRPSRSLPCPAVSHSFALEGSLQCQ